MCAIFGIIGEINKNLLSKMSKVQEYRGPDKQDFYYNDNEKICFGNNRLSVIDISNGHQPMYSNDKNYVIVFNGTIYNFKDIRNFLETKGLKFKTNSDTEIILNGYIYWGEKLFNYLDGMWAIAIYDNKKKIILLSRDYLGQKPLYIEKQKNKILFSSQCIGILQDNTYPRQVDCDNIKKFHFSSFLKSPYSLFKSIYQVAPSEIIEINIKNLEIKKKIFWDLKNGPDFNQFFSNDNDLFEKKFEKIIDNYCISDVQPMGLLSSGADSYLVNKFYTQKNKNFQTFTMSFEDKSYDEVKNFDKNFDIFKKNIYKPDSKELRNNTHEVLKSIDHLCGDSSIIPTYSLIKNIKKNTKVLISGDGGDEAFLGYIIFKAIYIANKIKILPKFTFDIFKFFSNFLPVNESYLNYSFRIKKFFSNINSNLNNLIPLWMSPLNIEDLSSLFEQNINENELCSEMNNLSDNFMRNSQLYFYKYYLPYSVLFKTDFSSMLNSVEYRSPLLSKSVINLSLNTDIEKLFNFYKQKQLMFKIFEKNLPKKIQKIPKHGFAFQKKIILKNRIDEFIVEKHLLNKKFFKKKINSYISGKEDCGQYLWNEIILTNVLNNLR